MTFRPNPPPFSVYLFLSILCFALVAATLTPACNQIKGDATDVAAALVNCTAQPLGTTPALDLPTLVAVINLAAAERSKCTPDGGALDYQCVETDLLAEGRVIGGCAFLKLLGTPTSGPQAMAMEVGTLPPGTLQFEDFRSMVAKGARYHTATGDR